MLLLGRGTGLRVRSGWTDSSGHRLSREQAQALCGLPGSAALLPALSLAAVLSLLFQQCEVLTWPRRAVQSLGLNLCCQLPLGRGCPSSSPPGRSVSAVGSRVGAGARVLLEEALCPWAHLLLSEVFALF